MTKEACNSRLVNPEGWPLDALPPRNLGEGQLCLSFYSGISRLFDKPKSGCIAVQVINHLGDEVMKVFRLD